MRKGSLPCSAIPYVVASNPGLPSVARCEGGRKLHTLGMHRRNDRENGQVRDAQVLSPINLARPNEQFACLQVVAYGTFNFVSTTPPLSLGIIVQVPTESERTALASQHDKRVYSGGRTPGCG